jgi:uncharacterized protein YggE
MKRFLIPALALVVARSAFAQPTMPPRGPAPVDTICVTGTGLVSVTPDCYGCSVAMFSGCRVM